MISDWNLKFTKPLDLLLQPPLVFRDISKRSLILTKGLKIIQGSSEFNLGYSNLTTPEFAKHLVNSAKL